MKSFSQSANVSKSKKLGFFAEKKMKNFQAENLIFFRKHIFAKQKL